MLIPEEKNEAIKKVTGFSYEEILAMSVRDFVVKIGKLQGTSIKAVQYQWFENQRKNKYKTTISPREQEVLDMFGGTII